MLKFRASGADVGGMAERGVWLRRRLTSVALLTLLAVLVQSLGAAPAQATPPSWTQGEEGSGPGEFWLPSGIFIDTQDRIWVCDSYNRRLQVFQYLKTDVKEPPLEPRP